MILLQAAIRSIRRNLKFDTLLNLRRVLVLLLFCLITIFFATSSFAGTSGSSTGYLNDPQPQFTGTAQVEIQNNLISANLQNANIPDVLNKIASGTGINITVGSGLTGKQVTGNFSGKDVEGAMREILRGYYYVLLYGNNPNNATERTLVGVEAKGEVIGSKTLSGKINTINIPYGSGTGEIGAYDEGEGEMGGPTSFAVNSDENIYIPDVINKRILIYSPDGDYLSDIPLNTPAADILIDSRGFIYIYALGPSRLYQLDPDGEPVTSIAVNGPYTVERLHLVNNMIYFTTCDAVHCYDYVIGRIINGLLASPTEEERTKPYPDPGELTWSGITYKSRQFVNGYNTYLDIIPPNGLSSRTLSLPYDGYVPGDLSGGDAKGDIYFARSYPSEKYQYYYVDKFDADANYIGTVKIPSGIPKFQATKDIAVTQNGNIYDFIPGKEELTLHIFIPNNN